MEGGGRSLASRQPDVRPPYLIRATRVLVIYRTPLDTDASSGDGVTSFYWAKCAVRFRSDSYFRLVDAMVAKSWVRKKDEPRRRKYVEPDTGGLLRSHHLSISRSHGRNVGARSPSRAHAYNHHVRLTRGTSRGGDGQGTSLGAHKGTFP